MLLKKLSIVGQVSPGYLDSGWRTQSLWGLPAEETTDIIRQAAGDGYRLSTIQVLECSIVEKEIDDWFSCLALSRQLRTTIESLEAP